jgi:hypothetical protein
MSKRQNDSQPEKVPILDLHVVLVSRPHRVGAPEPGASEEGEGCGSDHDAMIKYWESLRPVLDEQFDPEIGNGLINLQRLIKLCCEKGHLALARLLAGAPNLLAAAGGDEEYLEMGAVQLDQLAERVELFRHMERVAEHVGEAAAAAKEAQFHDAMAKKARTEAAKPRTKRSPKDVLAEAREKFATRGRNRMPRPGTNGKH